MLVGDVVFKSEVSAKLKKFTMSMNIEKYPIILYSYSLTTELAFYVLNNPVVGILTEESSFATHGANILRCRQNNNDRKLAWISGISIKKLAELEGREITIHGDGRIIEDDVELHDSIKEKKVFHPNPMKKRCIVEYDLSTNQYKLCYWPHRCYNLLTFSIWRKGLEKNLRLFGVNNPVIERDHNERIWFYNCPFLSDYVRLATDYDSAIGMLNKQIELYHSFYLKLKNEDYSSSDLIRMICDYFSVFLLFHETYEDVFLQAYHFFEKNITDDACYDVFNRLLQSKIDNWMLAENLLLIKSKNFLSDEEIVPIPPFTIYTDINETIQLFREYLTKVGYGNCWKQNHDQLVFYNKCFVAKEWKFVMIKILSTRFSRMVKEKVSKKNLDDISNMDISELAKLLEQNSADGLV